MKPSYPVALLTATILAPALSARPQTSLIRTDPPPGWEGFLMKTTVESGFIPAGQDLNDPATPRSSLTQNNTAWINPALPYPATADLGVPAVTATRNPTSGAPKDTATGTANFFYRLREDAPDEWGYDIDTTTSAVNARINFGIGPEAADAFVKVTLEIVSEGPYLVPDAYMALPPLPALEEPSQQQMLAVWKIGRPYQSCPTGTGSTGVTETIGYQLPSPGHCRCGQ